MGYAHIHFMQSLQIGISIISNGSACTHDEQQIETLGFGFALLLASVAVAARDVAGRPGPPLLWCVQFRVGYVNRLWLVSIGIQMLCCEPNT
jgi:hypothetical protein